MSKSNLLGQRNAIVPVHVLPQLPVGDIFATADNAEEGDVSDDDEEFGDAEVEVGDVEEEGAPRKKILTVAQLARKIARGTATRAEKQAYAKLKKAGGPAAREASSRVRDERRRAPRPVLFNHAKGARLLTSTLGREARLSRAEVSALRNHMYSSTPFEPVSITISGTVIDVEDELYKLIGDAPFFYTGVILVLSASADNINQGALVTITRGLGAVGSSTRSNTDSWELSSGIAATEFMLLNGTQIAGTPRYFAPEIKATPYVAPDPGDPEPLRHFKLTINGVPTGYSKFLRFQVPGDAQVDRFLGDI